MAGIPTLTWSQTEKTSTGYAAPTDQQVIQALNTASANLTLWEKTAVDDQGWNFIEFQSPTVDGHKMKVLVTVNPGDNGYCVVDTASDSIWIGLAPDSGTLGQWNTATPYGAARWSKYTKCCNTAKAENVYFVESSESLGIMFEDSSVDSNYGFIAGAIFEPMGGSAEADGRIYGILTSGSRAMSKTFWNSTQEFMSAGGSNYPHVFAFRPNSPTVLDAVNKMNGTIDVNTWTLSGFRDADAQKQIGFSPYYCTNQNPRYFVGRLRQVYMGPRTANRTVLPNGIVFGSGSATNDGAYLLNS